jgi:hypothetical protein
LRRNVSEVLLDEGARFIVIEISDDGDHGVVRRVVNTEKLFHVVDGGGVEIFHRSDC